MGNMSISSHLTKRLTFQDRSWDGVPPLCVFLMHSLYIFHSKKHCLEEHVDIIVDWNRTEGWSLSIYVTGVLVSLQPMLHYHVAIIQTMNSIPRPWFALEYPCPHVSLPYPDHLSWWISFGIVPLVPAPYGSPCQYDEGSPFVQELTDPANPALVIPTAIGIFSKTGGCKLENPGVYTRLSVYSKWLLETAGQQPTRSQDSSHF